MEFQAIFYHQLLLLLADLLDKTSSHRAHTADKEVEHLIFGEEERVVNHIQRFTQRL